MSKISQFGEFYVLITKSNLSGQTKLQNCKICKFITKSYDIKTKFFLILCQLRKTQYFTSKNCSVTLKSCFSEIHDVAIIRPNP